MRHICDYLKIYTTNTDKILLAADLAEKLVEHIDVVIVTLGDDGLIVARKGEAEDQLLNNKKQKVGVRFYPVEKIENVVNVSGAGDSLASGIIAAFLDGKSEDECVSVGFEAARTALFSKSTVATSLFGKEHPCWEQKAAYQTIK